MHVDIVEPFIIALLNRANVSPFNVDLSHCCPTGQVCCERCAYNMRFRGGHRDFCLSNEELIERVASGEKPVGEIPSLRLDTCLAEGLCANGLVVAQIQANRWKMVCYIFLAKETAVKRLSDYVDLQELERVSAVKLKDKGILEHARSDEFLNEHDTLLERGILYGYPLWSSVALERLKRL